MGKITTWKQRIKEAGVNIHVIATGAGAGLQSQLWEVPGSSAYLSGCSFPYTGEEQEELLGFMPEHFCSEENAIDLASAAYMKAYKFGGKKAVGIGMAASVASNREHHGDLRVHVCGITDDKVVVAEHTFEKAVGEAARTEQGNWCDEFGIAAILECAAKPEDKYLHSVQFKDASDVALQRFMARPYFTANGKRLDRLPKGGKVALMSGAFNPPHEGHFGVAQAALEQLNHRTVFEITAEPPHKDALTVQTLLQRAKLLQGHDRLFSKKLPYYVDKAIAYPKRALIMGADAMVRMLDPKWGLDVGEMFNTFYDLGTKLFICGREIDGNFTTCENILDDIKVKHPFKVWASARIVMMPLEGEWNISSTELRKKLI
jgi:nicotinic acid mononucleotide adenylyltransferase/nicotinamide mononucleotide (NMN) deamidase PncC